MDKLEFLCELMEKKVELLKLLQRSMEVERDDIQTLGTDQIQGVIEEIEDYKGRVQAVDLQFLKEFDQLKKDEGVNTLDEMVNASTREVISRLQILVKKIRNIEENIVLSEKASKELRLKRGRVLPNKNVQKQAASAYKKFK